MRFATIAELDLGAGATIRAWDRSTAISSMGDGCGGCLIDQSSLCEAVEGEGRDDRVGRAGGDEMREQIARAGGRLEAARSPTAIDE